MAIKTSLSRLARAVAQAVHRFAKQEGWNRNEYAMIARFDRSTDCVYMRVGSVRPLDQNRWFMGIMQELSAEFGSWALAAEHVNLVVDHLESLDQISHLYVLDDNDTDLTDMLD